MRASDELVAVVLAAGKGSRMHSQLPKVLHPVAGRPMLWWPLFALQEAGMQRALVVLGHEAEQIEVSLRLARAAGLTLQVETCRQPQQLGTGDALRCALPNLNSKAGGVLVLYGDCPLVQSSSLRALITAAKQPCLLAMLTAKTASPAGYGRILRNTVGQIVGVREHRGCSLEELQIEEINPGIYVIDCEFLRRSLAELVASPDTGELYLTDLVQWAAMQQPVVGLVSDMSEVRGVNDRLELTHAESALRQRIAASWARQGVTLRHLPSAFIDAEVILEADVTLEPQVHLRGRCRIGAGAHIDVGCVLSDVQVAAGAQLKPYTVACESSIGAAAQVGPFAHLRAKTELASEVRIGNFVETKQARFGRGAKASHLAYVGDAEVGAEANLGAGTICCNYDGVTKHRTIIEDGAFVGSDSQLVAPLRIGAGAYVATGTTVTEDVPAGGFAISRVRQITKGEGYAARLKARLKPKK